MSLQIAFVNETVADEKGMNRMSARIADSPQQPGTAGLPRVTESTPFAESLRAFHTESGRSLLELADESPILLVFLRHFGCAFCAMALDKVSQARARIEAAGVRPVFVHLGSPERARPYFDYYHLSTVERISNPDATLYQLPAFGLGRSSPFLQPFSLSVWRGWLRGAMFKYGIGLIREDGYQMPGVFLLQGRRIVRAFRHKSISDEPDYLKLAGIKG